MFLKEKRMWGQLLPSSGSGLYRESKFMSRSSQPYLFLRNGLPFLMSNQVVQYAGVEIEEGVDEVQRGSGDKQLALETDKIQAGLDQPVEEVSNELVVILHQLVEDVSVCFRDSIGDGDHVGFHQWLPAQL